MLLVRHSPMAAFFGALWAVVRTRLGSRILTTLLGWLAAYGIVMALFAALGSRLAALPSWASALVVSGTLVTFMVNFAMPAIQVVIGPTRADRQAAAHQEQNDSATNIGAHGW